MNLQELIDRLKSEDQNRKLKIGFNNPHSYRGYYYELAFEIVNNVRIGEMLSLARQSVGQCFNGYKGGLFTMDKDTLVHIASYGNTGVPMGIVIDMLLSQENTVALEDYE